MGTATIDLIGPAWCNSIVNQEKIVTEIASKIRHKNGAILDKLSQEDFDVYLFIKKEYAKGDILENHVFRFVFRSFYRVDGAGLTDVWKNRYFELFAEKGHDLATILRELYKFKTLRRRNALQFSFATKLLHTVDNSKPIYDSVVAKIIHRYVKQGGPVESRIKSCEEIYRDLIEICSALLSKDETTRLIARVREKFNLSLKDMSDEKVLDFILWALGKIIE